MDIIKQLQWRYATKSFDTTKKLSSQKIDLLKEAFNLTPTAYGLQPIKLVIVENKKLKSRLRECAYNQKQIVESSHLFVICIQKNCTAKDVEKYFQRVKEIRGTPDEILNPFKEQLLEVFDKKLSFEQIQIASARQAYIALGNLLTVCATQNIDACPMEGFEPQKFDEVLNLEKHNLQSVVLLAVGYRNEEDFMAKLKKVRKPLQDSFIQIV